MSREWARMRRRTVSIPERNGLLALWPVPAGLGRCGRRIGLIGITLAIFREILHGGSCAGLTLASTPS